MFGFTPSPDPRDAADNLAKLFSAPPEPSSFEKSLQQLQRLFITCSDNCPPACIAPGLPLTAEQHYQSELWLPLSEIRPAFYRLYRSALAYPPVLSSTPFAGAASWAGLTAGLPPFLQQDSLNPALLLKRLLVNSPLREKFIFWSFMPGRFYGNGTNRYPEQAGFIRGQLEQRKSTGVKLRCLDAACGDGAATYDLAALILDSGISPDGFAIEGWTIEPLEAWAAAHATFPHDPLHEAPLKQTMQPVLAGSATGSMMFRRADLLDPPQCDAAFDLILCNGLLGGPIVNTPEALARIIGNLVSLLNPGGLLLAADCFHGGWKQKCPQESLQALFQSHGLKVIRAGEGIGGVKG